LRHADEAWFFSPHGSEYLAGLREHGGVFIHPVDAIHQSDGISKRALHCRE
jgi:hypothetical protein